MRSPTLPAPEQPQPAHPAAREGTKMSETRDGGAAFPGKKRVTYGGDSWDWEPSSGMTLRDWFAGQALAGYFAAPHTPHQNATDAETARYLWRMADAMIAARAVQS
jgi:hypothetical protein